MSGSERYALYLAPEPGDPLGAFGASWLGYDAGTGEAVPQPAPPGLDAARMREMTAEPRLYGFHLTLKAPFRLAPDASAEMLGQAVAKLAARHLPFGPLELEIEARTSGHGHGFLCLAPAKHSPALHALERDAVIAIDPFRAPLTQAEIARRRPERLSQRQRSHLDAHGYPYVLDEFRPHFSLTGMIGDVEAVRGHLAALLAEEVGPPRFHCRSIAIFVQPEPGARFRIYARIPLEPAGKG